jgi:hypothetical protein
VKKIRIIVKNKIIGCNEEIKNLPQAINSNLKKDNGVKRMIILFGVVLLTMIFFMIIF